MSIFARKVRGLAEPIPSDPNDAVVDDLRSSYPYGTEAFGIKAIIRIVVWTVFEMKKRGLI